MLRTARMSPELLVHQSNGENEIYGYSPGQGSPVPGEIASPKSYFQSPSLPDSGLTEFNVASPEIHRPPPGKPQEMPALTDSGLSSEPPQKHYMGVRVKMPVRELLRKIRLAKGLDPTHNKEASLMKTATKGSSGKTEKRRVHPYTEKQHRQSKQSIGQISKGLEDLDILVEVLQEDLNKSQPKELSLGSAPDSFLQGFSSDPQATPWETGVSKHAAAGLQGRCHSLTKLHSYYSSKDCKALLQGETETSHDHKNMQEPDSPGLFPRTSEKESDWWMHNACIGSQRDFLRLSACTVSPCYNSAGSCPEVFLEANTGPPDFQTHFTSTLTLFAQQDLSAISFFQFQLHREESLLRNIPADKLLAPDENGNRLLHKAVAQGRRALTYALARRFAFLNKIDEKDAQKRTALHLAAEKNQHLMVNDLISLGANVNEQDSAGKTPLHLCAENGYLRVLEVLKSFKENGMCVEVNITDYHGLTPLHCAALSHTVLVMESQKTDISTDMGKFLKLRKDQILEGINCLLQMGGKPELQVLNSCQVTTPCLKIQENTELMQLLQTHKPRRQNIPQEDYGLLDSPRRMPYPSPPGKC